MAQRVFSAITYVSGFLILMHSIAFAEEVGHVYGGISYSQTIAKDTSSRNLGTYKPMTLGIGLSVVVLENMALDGYVFTGVHNDTNTLTTNRTMTVSAKDGYGFNLRPFLPLNHSWILYGKLGRQYGSQETVIKSTNQTLSTTNATYAHTIYGMGLGYSLDDKWGISIDYTKAMRIPSENTNTALISLGVRYKF